MRQTVADDTLAAECILTLCKRITNGDCEMLTLSRTAALAALLMPVLAGHTLAAEITYFQQNGTPQDGSHIAIPSDGSNVTINSVTVAPGDYIVMSKAVALSAVFPNGPTSNGSIVACVVTVGGTIVDWSASNIPSPINNTYWRANIVNMTTVKLSTQSTIAVQCYSYAAVTDMWIQGNATLVVTPVYYIKG